MYKRDKILKEQAEKRLEAIREFTDLGSGFKIAMRDLEIRGAGNILGRTQHGHMEAVGYDLYCKMLNDAVKKLKGQKTEEADYETQVDLDVDAYIPADYILNEVQKLDIYKRIAAVETENEGEELKDELRDRFGVVPKSAHNLVRISLIRVKAHRCYVTEIKGSGEKIRFTMFTEAKVDVAAIPNLVAEYKGRLQFAAGKTPSFTLRYEKTGVIEKDEENLLKLTEDFLDNMEKQLIGRM